MKVEDIMSETEVEAAVKQFIKKCDTELTQLTKRILSKRTSKEVNNETKNSKEIFEEE